MVFMPTLKFPVASENKRDSIDVFLKVAGYLECAVSDVLPRIPFHLRSLFYFFAIFWWKSQFFVCFFGVYSLQAGSSTQSIRGHVESTLPTGISSGIHFIGEFSLTLDLYEMINFITGYWRRLLIFNLESPLTASRPLWQ